MKVGEKVKEVPEFEGDIGWTRVIGALKHRNYRFFWMGQLISLIGTWMQGMAQVWLVLQLTNSPFLLGLTSAIQFMPVLVFSLLAGVIIDRIPKQKILIATQVSLLILALILGILTLIGIVRYWHILILAGLLGIANTFDMPTRQSIIIEMVGKKDLVNAIALNSSIFNLGRIIGPALAGLIIVKLGVAACFMLNAASYIPIITVLLLMKFQTVKPGGDVRARISQNIIEGLRFIRKTPVILNTMTLMALISIFVMNLSVLVPILAKDNLGQHAMGFGLLMSATGIGALAGAVILAVASGIGTRRSLLVGAAASLCIFQIFLAVSSSFTLAFIFLVLAGWAMMTFRASVNTTLQLNVPDNLRGRVMSVDALVFSGVTPIGSIFSGSIAHIWGAPMGLVVGSTAGLLCLVFIMLHEKHQMKLC